ncbi:MAG: J domain-containing protein [Anaerolineae bacterium]|nr:J domain-containing protein [Anaerolineae bacterium]
MRRKITYEPDRDYYTLLEIETHATAHEVRQAYRRCVREVHPDLNPDRAAWATAQLQLVNEAYTVLSDPPLREEYDLLRWPHIPHTPHVPPDAQWGSMPRPRGKAEPSYDYNRPWWEQAAQQTPPGFADPDPDSNLHVYYTDGVAPRPVWLIVADWLREHGLASLESMWLLLVGLWRSPHAGLLTMLGIALTLNVCLIAFAFAEPDTWHEVQAWFEAPADDTAHAPPARTLTPTLAVLRRDCGDDRMRITVPVSEDILGDEFSIYGTVQHPDLWSYEIAMGYLGRVYRTTEPHNWAVVRPAPLNQSIAERPIVEGLLTTTPVDLTGQPPGYYALRLRVTLRSGAVLEPCDVLVQR